MSEWTHISGVIRFDSWSKNTFPEPANSKKNIEFELNTINYTFNINKPQGSEGPLEVNTIVTARGPSLIITGDLRDFGREDISNIIEWLNESYKIVRRKFNNSSVDVRLTILRDVHIQLDLENEEEEYYICFNFEKEKFECYTCNSYAYVKGQKLYDKNK
ncbi:MAG: hypothetical protein GWP10_13500 [Nitrospiraceae bacterium]|nr:hypothetical protein [Nitrospiraceae bacterium]